MKYFQRYIQMKEYCKNNNLDYKQGKKVNVWIDYTWEVVWSIE